jgi:hypothetical protein
MVAMARGAVSALAADVRVLPPRSRTYRRVMPRLRRIAPLLRMGPETVGDEPNWDDVRRAIQGLSAALADARAGAERLINVPENTARALGASSAEALREAGAQLAGTVDRITSGVERVQAEWSAQGRAFAGAVGGGIAMVAGLLLVAWIFMNKRK